MKEPGKTKEQLINELVELRQRIAASEASLAAVKQQLEATRACPHFMWYY